ncbi:MAG: general stress protein [Kribbellaceae bacterium]
MSNLHSLPSMDPRPSGWVIGTYDTYLEAQRAVDYLSDEKFPVEHTTIVGNNLRQVEKITGRLTWGRALTAGLASGAWFGLFVGLLLGIFVPEGSSWLAAVLTGVLLGSLFGMTFGAIGYAQLRGRRDFTSRTSVVATTYDVLCDHKYAEEARNHLARLALRGDVNPRVQNPPPPTSAQPPAQPHPQSTFQPDAPLSAPQDAPPGQPPRQAPPTER